MIAYNTYIFDLDGTLLDTLGDLAASVNYALRTHGMPEHSLDDVRRFVGTGVRLLMERAVPLTPDSKRLLPPSVSTIWLIPSIPRVPMTASQRCLQPFVREDVILLWSATK